MQGCLRCDELRAAIFRMANHHVAGGHTNPSSNEMAQHGAAGEEVVARPGNRLGGILHIAHAGREMDELSKARVCEIDQQHGRAFPRDLPAGQVVYSQPCERHVTHVRQFLQSKGPHRLPVEGILDALLQRLADIAIGRHDHVTAALHGGGVDGRPIDHVDRQRPGELERLVVGFG